MKNLYLIACFFGLSLSAQQNITGGGGEDFLLQGNNSFDLDLTGCESNDPAFPNLRFTVSGVQTGLLISDGSGQYALALAQGVHTLTPTLENPEYFDVAPSQVTVNFPDDTNPALRNFCVSANGINPDMEIVVIPVGSAVPGTEASYRIIYRNKGNQLMSGSVNLMFDQNAMGFTVSSPHPDDQSPGILSFDFEDLNPFRANEVLVHFNLNPDSGTSPLSPGDEIAFTATVETVEDDVNPTDNSYSFTDIAVSSPDTSQLICVEGTSVGTSAIGEFVHYLVRFENPGANPVQNLAIASELDPSELDVSSVVVVKGSHDFHARVTGNSVIFYMDNIALPGVGAENEGYILYRVRTAQTLVAGSTFSNSATIYFDSVAVPTNTYTTTVQALTIDEFGKTRGFAISPNPGVSHIAVNFDPALGASGVAFYNLMGQKVADFDISGSGSALNVSSLAAGVYLARIESPSGGYVTRFVKK